jgi:hypothetical protein
VRRHVGNHKEADMSEKLASTHNLILAADRAYFDEATEGVTWERRGLLQRLVRTRSDERDAAERQPGR